MRARTIAILGAGGVAALLALVGTATLFARAAGRAEQKLGWAWPWDDDTDKGGDAPCANRADDQCGGKDWKGATCCPEQHSCEAESEWFSSCKETTCGNEAHDQCGGAFWFHGETCCPAGYECKTTVPLVYKKCYRNDECPNHPWDQCGGKDWQGEHCCPEHHTCVMQDDGAYAQCKPDAKGESEAEPLSEGDAAWSEVQMQGAELTAQLKSGAAVTADQVQAWAADAQAFAAQKVAELQDAQGEAKADLAEQLAELQAKMTEVEAAARARGQDFVASLPTLEQAQAAVGRWAKDASSQAKRWWVSTSEAVHSAWKNRHARWSDFKQGMVDRWDSCGNEENGDPCTDDGHCCDGFTCYEQTACIKANPEVFA